MFSKAVSNQTLFLMQTDLSLVEAAKLSRCQHGQVALCKNKYSFGTVLGCNLTFSVKLSNLIGLFFFSSKMCCVDTSFRIDRMSSSENLFELHTL